MIEFESVSFSYDAPKKGGRKNCGDWAVQGISFKLEQGECLGIAGSTGSGKSTLLQLAKGLIVAQEGYVAFDGLLNGAECKKKTVFGQVGLVMQYPERQLFASSVIEDVMFGPIRQGLSKQEAQQRAKQALQLVGLQSSQIETRNPFHLSAGQQRKVALAGVLAMRPSVLAFDEPNAGLDPKAHREFNALITRLNKDEKLSVIIASHNMDDLEQHCNRIMLLESGRMCALGSVQKIFLQTDLLRRLGLDAPSAQACALTIQEAGLSLPLQDSPFTLDSLATAIIRKLKS